MRKNLDPGEVGFRLILRFLFAYNAGLQEI
jgi:hypothetical protein